LTVGDGTYLKISIDIVDQITRVAELTELTPDMITDDVRDVKRPEARSISCYWATEKPGITQSRLALVLKRSQSAIVYAVRRGRAAVENRSYLIARESKVLPSCRT